MHFILNICQQVRSSQSCLTCHVKMVHSVPPSYCSHSMIGKNEPWTKRRSYHIIKTANNQQKSIMSQLYLPWDWHHPLLTDCIQQRLDSLTPEELADVVLWKRQCRRWLPTVLDDVGKPVAKISCRQWQWRTVAGHCVYKKTFTITVSKQRILMQTFTIKPCTFHWP